MKLVKTLKVGVASLITALALNSTAYAQTTLEEVIASGKLRIGGVTDAAPTFKKDRRSGEWEGIFIDIAESLANDLGVELEVVTTTWGNSVLDLQADKIDMMFGLNPTEARKKVINFSSPVFNNAFTLVARKNAQFETWEDYNKPEIRIAVDAGSAHDATVTRLLPNATILRFDNVSEASIALQSGKADAQCFVMMLSLPIVKKNPQLGTVIAPSPVAYTTSHAGFQKRGDTSLEDYVNAWLAKNSESGFIGEAVIRNMSLVGVTPADFPSNLKL
ncbi:MAG: transporter substrate-binding domain-containing protein [Marinomonas sp.]|uniref:transporter substrate-binding domain-containing protein n=1 Tax=Marinomonas TaxID=28253 RepID=UPI0029343525|nr:transporter substrate-binding domain-containing protein [Marinomonas sp. GJ51-6]WOD07397.1 transporter substrate-binding domain-containing protein [Marinomonas sp. GJ51-6]